VHHNLKAVRSAWRLHRTFLRWPWRGFSKWRQRHFGARRAWRQLWRRRQRTLEDQEQRPRSLAQGQQHLLPRGGRPLQRPRPSQPHAAPEAVVRGQAAGLHADDDGSLVVLAEPVLVDVEDGAKVRGAVVQHHLEPLHAVPKVSGNMHALKAAEGLGAPRVVERPTDGRSLPRERGIGGRGRYEVEAAKVRLAAEGPPGEEAARDPLDGHGRRIAVDVSPLRPRRPVAPRDRGRDAHPRSGGHRVHLRDEVPGAPTRQQAAEYGWHRCPQQQPETHPQCQQD